MSHFLTYEINEVFNETKKNIVFLASFLQHDRTRLQCVESFLSNYSLSLNYNHMHIKFDYHRRGMLIIPYFSYI